MTLLVCVVGACTGASDDAGAPRVRAAAGDDGKPASLSLLYVDGIELHRLEVVSGRRRLVRRMPSADVYAAPGSRWIAAVADAAPPAEGEEDFASDPVLRLLDPLTDTNTRLGAGFSPLWDQEGRRVAWLRPVGRRVCTGEVCSGDVEVAALETETRTPETLLPPGGWGLLAWADDRLLVSSTEDLSATAVVSLDGRRGELPVPPAEVWGASPDGRALVRVGRRASLVALEDDALGERIMTLPGRALAEGAWSPDSSTLAVIALSGAGRVPRAHLLLVSPEDRSVRRLEGSRGATGSVLWSPDGTRVAFARPSGPGGRRLEAVLCAVEPGGDCRALLEWREGVVLLRLDQG